MNSKVRLGCSKLLLGFSSTGWQTRAFGQLEGEFIYGCRKKGSVRLLVG